MSAGESEGRELQAEAIERRMASHVAELMSAARQSAEALQADVERAAKARAKEIETVAARRAHDVRMAAEADAERLQVQNRAATQQYVAASRRLVDEFAKERMRRIAEIGDALGEQATALVERVQRSDELAGQLNELRAELAAVSERIAAEARIACHELPQLAAPPSISGEAPSPAGATGAVSGGPLKTPEQRLARATARAPAGDVPEPAEDAGGDQERGHGA